MKVAYVVEVPEGQFWWAGADNGPICQQFDNEGGTPFCELFKTSLKRNDSWDVEKAPECLALEEVEKYVPSEWRNCKSQFLKIGFCRGLICTLTGFARLPRTG